MPTIQRQKKKIKLTISIFIQFIIKIVWVSDRKLLCTPTEEGSPNHPLPGYSLVHPRSHRPIPGPAPQAQRSRSPKADEETWTSELEEELSQESHRTSSQGWRPSWGASSGEPLGGSWSEHHGTGCGEERVFGIAQDLLWVFMGRNQRQEKERIYMTHG